VENRGVKRVTATIFAGIITWLMGLLTVFSFQKDSPIIFSFMYGSEKKENGIFDILDILTANIMLPVGGVLIAIFAGWFMSREASRDELDLGETSEYELWRLLVQYFAPAMIIIVLLKLIGVLDPILDMFSRTFEIFFG
jgi:NSS family neurotransmitter:Na+ symporter